MRRRDREITDVEEMRQVLETCKVIHVGLHDGDDIYILPMNYGYTLEDGKLTFYMHGGVRGKKLDLIRRCSNAAFELDCDHELIQGRIWLCQHHGQGKNRTGRRCEGKDRCHDSTDAVPDRKAV